VSVKPSMVENQKERDARLRRTEPNWVEDDDTTFTPVKTLPEKKTTTGTSTMETAPTEGRSITEKVGDTLHEAKEDVKQAITPDKPRDETRETVGLTQPEKDRVRIAQKDERLVAGTTMTRPGVEGEKRADWETIQHPGMVPRDTDPYGTRPVSELTPPSEITDKADLAAVRMMERDREEQERMKTGAAVTGATMAGAAGAQREDEDIMSLATEEAAAARTAKAAEDPMDERKKTGAAMVGAAAAGTAAKEVRETRTTTETRLESEADRERARAAATGAALGAGAAASRTEPAAAERTTRAGAAIDTDTTHHVVTERPVTGTVVPPGVTTTTPLKPYGAVDERTRRHAEDPSVHPDWETQPQINAPRDVGIPTAEGQADAARIRAGRRRSDEAKEPRIERRGDDIDVPAASGARVDTDRGIIGATKEAARDVTDATKDTARGVTDATKKAARDVDRKI